MKTGFPPHPYFAITPQGPKGCSNIVSTYNFYLPAPASLAFTSLYPLTHGENSIQFIHSRFHLHVRLPTPPNAIHPSTHPNHAIHSFPFPSSPSIHSILPKPEPCNRRRRRKKSHTSQAIHCAVDRQEVVIIKGQRTWYHRILECSLRRKMKKWINPIRRYHSFNCRLHRFPRHRS